jgi:hypothetical protein
MAEEMQVWLAWWEGDPDKLATIYRERAVHNKYANRKTRRYNLGHQPGTENNTFFWGRPNDDGTARRHISAPASVSRASAGLLFSKPARISPGPADEADPAIVERMEKIFGTDAYGAELFEMGEWLSVLGGVYLRPWWDRELADHVVPSHIKADRAIPETRYNRLVAVTFWVIVSEPGDSPVIRHLERHEKGKIIHTLHAGTETHLGEQVPLDTHPATSWLTPDDDELTATVETGLDELDVVYAPNLQPNRIWHDRPGLSFLGRSDYEGIEGEFDALDEVHSSWLRDVKDAKSRLFISEDMVPDHGPGEGASYDSEKHLYVRTQTGMGSAADGGTPPIQDVKFPIRWEEHAQTSTEIKQHILEHVGISAQHFADGPLAVTATAVDSSNNITETTRSSKITFAKRALTKFVEIVMKLDAIHFPEQGVNLTDTPVVRFAAQHIVSEAETAQTVATKRSSGTISQYQGIQANNPDWTDAQVKEELARIRNDAEVEMKLAFGPPNDDEDDAATPTEGMDPDLEDVDTPDDLDEQEQDTD